jgi:hypothetical protein
VIGTQHEYGAHGTADSIYPTFANSIIGPVVGLPWNVNYIYRVYLTAPGSDPVTPPAAPAFAGSWDAYRSVVAPKPTPVVRQNSVRL